MSGLAYLKNKQRSLGKNIKLRSDKTYIIPTGFGISFAGISFVLLVMAIGYGNNLLYFFVFLLVSIALTGMWFTNKNVESFKILQVIHSAVFANQPNYLTIEFKNKNQKSFLWSIEIEFDTPKKTQVLQKKTMIEEVQKQSQAELEWTPNQRGLIEMPRLLIQSRFPYQMLRAWKYDESLQSVIVYPEKKGVSEIPSDQGLKSENENQFQQQNQGLFRDYREFQRTDSPSRIDWKRSLKHQKHLIKNYENSGEKRILIDWKMTDFLKHFEDRVSQMSLWIDLSYHSKDIYSIKIKDNQTEYMNTPLHYKNCMEKLALLSIEETR